MIVYPYPDGSSDCGDYCESEGCIDFDCPCGDCDTCNFNVETGTYDDEVN